MAEEARGDSRCCGRSLWIWGKRSLWLGVIYELANSQSGWGLDTLWNFQGQIDGYSPYGLVRDNVGNLYGTRLYGGQYGDGTVFELSPSSQDWTFSVIYTFNQVSTCGGGSIAPLALDSADNLYGWLKPALASFLHRQAQKLLHQLSQARQVGRLPRQRLWSVRLWVSAARYTRLVRLCSGLFIAWASPVAIAVADAAERNKTMVKPPWPPLGEAAIVLRLCDERIVFLSGPRA
jgi:uncharacterized repeat protein (TIGR03803 family)